MQPMEWRSRFQRKETTTASRKTWDWKHTTVHALRNYTKKIGVSVSFCAQKTLHTLIQASGIDYSPLTPKEANEVNEGQWMPLLSAAKHLKVSHNNTITTELYIQSKDEPKAKWASILKAKEKPVVGINWRGNRKDASKKQKHTSQHLQKKQSRTIEGAFYEYKEELYTQRSKK